MSLSIARVRVLPDSYVLRLRLTDGSVVDRDFAFVRGPVFDRIWRSPRRFRQVRVVRGGLVWPGDVDVCTDAVLWGGLPHGRPRSRAMIGPRGTLVAQPLRRRL